MANNDYSSINILLLTVCYLSALFLVHKIVDHKIVDQPNLIENSVTFWSPSLRPSRFIQVWVDCQMWYCLNNKL